MTWTRRKFIKTGLMAGAGLIIAESFWVEKFFLEVREFYIGKTTKENATIKVVQVSDLHIQSLSYQVKQLAKKLNALNPELILITGDAVDASENLIVLNNFLNLVDRKIKKVAILGNWEYWGGIDITDLEYFYSDNNCDLLINRNKQYSFGNKTITITGVDDYVGGNANIEAAVKDFNKSDHHIILNHCPAYSDLIADQIPKEIAVDFILSGHTHGGQVNLFGWIPFLPRGSGKYVKGWYNDGSKKMYVSKGIGTSILPIRFLARPEIAVFYLGNKV